MCWLSISAALIYKYIFLLLVLDAILSLFLPSCEGFTRTTFIILAWNTFSLLGPAYDITQFIGLLLPVFTR